MAGKKLKIAIFHLAFLYSGGGERLVLEEAIGLSQEGHEVVCFSPIIDTKRCFPELFKKVQVKQLIPELPSWVPDKELFSIIFSCIAVPFLFFTFREFDIYFGANQPGPWIAYALSLINKKPYAIYLAQPTRLLHPRLIDQQTGLRISDGFTLLNVITRLFKPLISYLDSKSIRGTHLIFANGSYAKGVIDEMYRVNSINCPAGTRIDETSKREKIHRQSRGTVHLNGFAIKKPYILLTNRHFPQKKFEYAIDAVMSLKKRMRLVITGEETEYTVSLKKRFRGNHSVVFTGLLSEKDLAMAYANANIYVYPAPEEDFGMGVVEAMGHALPVVAWGNAGPTGIITHNEDGLLAKPFSIEDFAACVRRLLEDEKLYFKISKNAYKKAKEHFTYEKHNQKLDFYLRKYVQKKRNRASGK